jgi:hypothetical protein
MKLIEEAFSLAVEAEPASISNLRELIRFLQSPDMGFSKSGGNGGAKAVGQNLEISDSYFYGSQRAIDTLEKAWTTGHYAKYFRENYGITFDLISSRSDEGDSNGGKVHIVLKPTFSKKEAGSYSDQKYYDGFGNRMGGASDEGEEDPKPIDFRTATYSVYIGKKAVKSGLPGNRATAYAAAIRKSKPTAEVSIRMDL